MPFRFSLSSVLVASIVLSAFVALTERSEGAEVGSSAASRVVRSDANGVTEVVLGTCAGFEILESGRAPSKQITLQSLRKPGRVKPISESKWVTQFPPVDGRGQLRLTRSFEADERGKFVFKLRGRFIRAGGYEAPEFECSQRSGFVTEKCLGSLCDVEKQRAVEDPRTRKVRPATSGGVRG